MTAPLTPSALAWLAFGLGGIFGAVARHTDFCTMGAVSDVLHMGDWRRMRMWLLAIATAILGTAALQLSGNIDVGRSIYTAPRLNGLAHLAGGLLFGAGMTLASGCGSKTLVRIGGGNLKSLVVFMFLGVSAYMTMRGMFGSLRESLQDNLSIRLASQQDLPSLIAANWGIESGKAWLFCAAVIGGGLALFALSGRDFLTRGNLLGGLASGTCVVAGWYLRGHLGYIPDDPDTLQEAFVATNSGRMESLSFVAPYAYSLELLMLWSDASRVVTFGIASAAGVMAGALAHALTTRSFRLESFRDAPDLLRHLAGAVLMGFGGVTALGCSIGQGLTGLSTLALGAFITFPAIIAGAAIAMKFQLWLMMRSN
ncbi:MAG: YeeE/YedE family protein [Zoogloea sp.]|nr:YeeE/YedE family protein [Zoogloea sp.]